MNDREPVIIVRNLSYRYPRGKDYALRDLTLTIYRGEFVAILGENGAGKSTFCQTLNGVLPNSRGGRMSGSVIICGFDTQQVGVPELAQRVGIVLEDPETQLFTTTVLHEVAFGPENLGLPRDEILQRVVWALRVVRLEGYENRLPSTLSGGEKQRLAIAAALAMRPEVLVLDEATSQLDPVGSYEIFSVTKALNRQHGMTVVMATDRAEEVAEFADRVFVLHRGELIAEGPPAAIFSDATLNAQAMLRLPQVSQLAMHLAQHGAPLARFPVTVPEAIAVLGEELSLTAAPMLYSPNADDYPSRGESGSHS
ncbi:MAG: ATP-binding cassette domain-containing protein [Chloroflexi bacterium]|nr:ATP-binding cassette domain-containing protein [Chloroflexota bacterium]